MPNAKKVKIRVLYGCYHAGVRYDPGVYEVNEDVAAALLRTMHAVKHEPIKRAAKVEEEGVEDNGS